jgi:Na+(H+)/acetate symporter ActP
MSAYWKIPLQVLVLVLGVLVFVFYVFNEPPLLFNPAHVERVERGDTAAAYAALESEYAAAFTARREAASNLALARQSQDPARQTVAVDAVRQSESAFQSVRRKAADLVRATGDTTSADVNYIVPRFILDHLPVGLIGLLIVAIIMAATDTIAGELNSLSTATVIDFYKRRIRLSGSDAHYLAVSKVATGLWGLFACAVAVWAAELGSLIEVVNRFGSFFYGSILGVFILAVAFPRATGNGAFIGLIAGMSSVAWAASFTRLAFLWHNVIGAVAVVVVGLIVSWLDRRLRSAGQIAQPPHTVG